MNMQDALSRLVAGDKPQPCGDGRGDAAGDVRGRRRMPRSAACW